MQKTKLGVSVGLLGAAAYFSAAFGGYVAMFIVAGYILLCEENEWLKKTAVKAVTLMITVGVLITAIGLIPDVLRWLSSFLTVFNVYITTSTVNTLFDSITDAIDIIRTVFFLVLGVKALNQGTVSVPVVDNLINKYMA